MDDSVMITPTAVIYRLMNREHKPMLLVVLQALCDNRLCASACIVLLLLLLFGDKQLPDLKLKREMNCEQIAC